MYVVSALARDIPIAQGYRRVAVFLAADAVRLVLLLLVPALSLWLVQFVR
jgi:TRAP-type C4-dicarboxylate transport system permease large subunit